MKPTVNVSIAAPASATWTVPSSSFQNLVVIHPQQQASGWYDSDITASYKGSDGVITNVELSLTSKITMPTWPGYGAAKKSQQAEWNRFYKALLAHENNHHTIATNGTNRLAAEIRGVDNLKPGQIDALVKKGLAAINKEQKEYDAKTNHGQTEGVYLDTSIGRVVNGDGGSCFEGSTLILLSNGHTKRIDELSAGDTLRVCSVDGKDSFDAELVELKVEPHTSYNVITFSSGTRVVVSRRQPILTACGSVRSMYLLEGAQVYGCREAKDISPKIRRDVTVEKVDATFDNIDLYCPDFSGDFCVFASPDQLAFPGTIGGPIKD